MLTSLSSPLLHLYIRTVRVVSQNYSHHRQFQLNEGTSVLCVLPLVCVLTGFARVYALMKIKRASCTYRVLCFFGEILDRTPGVQDPEPETGKSRLKIIIADDLHVINVQTGRPNY